MPTYEYLCQSCGARFEAWQKITDDPINICPTCGEPVHRVLFPVGLVFKGGGFYKTDSRGTNSAAIESSDKPAAAEKATSEAANEAKPAASKAASEAKPASKPVAAPSGE